MNEQQKTDLKELVSRARTADEEIRRWREEDAKIDAEITALLRDIHETCAKQERDTIFAPELGGESGSS